MTEQTTFKDVKIDGDLTPGKTVRVTLPDGMGCYATVDRANEDGTAQLTVQPLDVGQKFYYGED